MRKDIRQLDAFNGRPQQATGEISEAKTVALSPDLSWSGSFIALEWLDQQVDPSGPGPKEQTFQS